MSHKQHSQRRHGQKKDKTPKNFEECKNLIYNTEKYSDETVAERLALALKQDPSLLNAIDPKYFYSTCNTLLHLCALKNRVKSSDFLISMGANLDARTRSLESPLHFAVFNDSYDVALLLLEKYKYNVNAVCRSGRLAIFSALSVRMLNLLLKFGSFVNTIDNHNFSLFTFKLSSELSRSCQVKILIPMFKTLLQHASLKVKQEALEYALDSNFNTFETILLFSSLGLTCSRAIKQGTVKEAAYQLGIKMYKAPRIVQEEMYKLCTHGKFTTVSWQYAS